MYPDRVVAGAGGEGKAQKEVKREGRATQAEEGKAQQRCSNLLRK
jgi:hypothetical protein